MVRTLRAAGDEAVGIDVNPSPYTEFVSTVSDRAANVDCMDGVDVVFHTATLHKPHVVTHSKSDFIETNIQGTLVLLEEAVAAKVSSFIYTSTTSLFGDALRPPADQPAAWVTEDITPIPKNIYGVTKSAAEDLCHLFHRQHSLDCIALRTSRFFPEDDDDDAKRSSFSRDNLKTNELLYWRAEIADVVSAHLLAAQRAPDLHFGLYIISATSPFERTRLGALRNDAPSVLRDLLPEYEAVYEDLGWHMFEGVDRVYVNEAARRCLGWEPQYSFKRALDYLARGKDPRSPLAQAIRLKGYHKEVYEDGPYPV
jgi:UDP-glucose 4-epimerase